MILAGLCAHCGAKLYEGQAALYDDYRDQYFCADDCFREWYGENVEMLAAEYRALNVERCDL